MGSNGNKLQLIGQRFGRWTVIAQGRRTYRGASVYWLCLCDCGTKREVVTGNLRKGLSTSCGCRNREVTAVRMKKLATTHGMSKGGTSNHGSPTYITWLAMRQRCRDTNRYGRQRGITICPEWNNFETFLADMGIRPPGKTLDRID